MKGVAQLVENEAVIMVSESKPGQTGQNLGASVRESLRHYFTQLDGQAPANLYNMVLAEIEKPLLEMVLNLTKDNQSKAAKVLGLSRGTLRKKMAIYQLL